MRSVTIQQREQKPTKVYTRPLPVADKGKVHKNAKFKGDIQGVIM